jgi:hypothetical protein
MVNSCAYNTKKLTSLSMAADHPRPVEREDERIAGHIRIMGQALPEQDFSERRALERMATTLRGKVFPGALDCLITDYNAKGARLHFEERPVVGDRIVLVVWSSGLAFEATPRWRAGNDAGVQFTFSCDFRGRVPAHLAAIRAEWKKRRPHIRRKQMLRTSAMIQTRPGRSGGWLG